MQPQTLMSVGGSVNLPAATATPQLNASATEYQLPVSPPAWLEHQITPLSEVQWRGVPDSPLHE